MLLAPPSEPKDINITELTDSIVVVAWSPPADNGGRNDVKYDVQCTTCSNSGSCSKYCNGAQFWPGSVDLTSLQVTITGLNSDTVYNISVISKNGVSSQAGIQSLQRLHKTFSIRKNAETTTSPGTTTAVMENFTTTESTKLNSFCYTRKLYAHFPSPLFLHPTPFFLIINYSFNPFTPRISLVILLTVCHTVLIMLVWRIWYWPDQPIIP